MLGKRYRQQFLDDALNSGFARKLPDGSIELEMIKKKDDSFIGTLFESWLCRKMIEFPKVGLSIFRWATNTNWDRRTEYDKFRPFVTGSPILNQNRNLTPFYNTSHAADIMFYAARPEPPGSSFKPGFALIKGTTMPAGIQVKAVRTNLKSQIVDPVLNNKYQHVLSLLLDEDNFDTSSACHRIIEKLRFKKEINNEEARRATWSIKGPQDFSLQSDEVSRYEKYARSVYAAQKHDDFDRKWLQFNESQFDELASSTVCAERIDENGSAIIIPDRSIIISRNAAYRFRGKRIEIETPTISPDQT